MSYQYVRLVPFIYSTDIVYKLEFGNLYIRVFYNDAVLTDSAGAEVWISSPYAVEDLFELQFHQLGDTLWIVHPDYEPRKLKRTDPETFSLDIIEFNKGPFLTRNDLADMQNPSTTTMTYTGALTIGTTGALVSSAAYFLTGHAGSLFKLTHPRTTVVSQLYTGGLTTGTVPMVYHIEDFAAGITTICPAIDVKGSFTFTTHDTWSGTVVLERNDNNSALWDLVQSTTSANDTNTQYTKVEDGDNVQYRVRVTNFTEGHLRASITVNNPTQDSIVRITSVTNSTTCVVETVTKMASSAVATTRWAEGCWSTVRGFPTSITFFEDRCIYAGRTVAANTFGLPQDADSASGTLTANGNTDELTVMTNDSYTMIMDIRDRSAFDRHIYLYFERSDDAGATWSTVYSVDTSLEKKYSYTGLESTADCVYRVRVTGASYAFVINYSLSATTPATASVEIARKVLQTVWLSHTGDYENFETGVTDSDSFSLTIPSTNDIRWIEALQSLLLGTAGDEYWIGSNKIDTPLTPTNFSARQQSMYGSAKIQPLKINSSILFVDFVRRKLREMVLSPNDVMSNKYVTPDLTALAEHITKTGITSMAHQRNPDSIVWCTLTDGSLISMTYDREQDVVAWAKHPIDGIVMSVCVTPSSNEDDVWIAVGRTINSVDYTYIERFAPRIYGSSLADAYFVDCGITFSSIVATTSVTGLTHLIGETVSILADGVVQAQKTVSGTGTVTLDTAASTVQIGLPFTSKVTPMRMDAGLRDGTTHGSTKKIAEIVVSLLDSAGVEYGDSDSNLYTMGLTDVSLINKSSITNAFTGDVPLHFDGGFSLDDAIVISSDAPLPLTVRGIVARVEKVGR